MKTFTWSAGLAALLVVGLPVAAQQQEFEPERLPGWSFTPSITFGALFDSNLSLTSQRADAESTDVLDRMLWMQPALSFVPHCRLASPQAADTPVIVDDAREHEGPLAVLINLAAEPPPFFSRFERLAEIVAADAVSIEAGRERYRFYRERGYALRTHNLAGQGD